MEQKFITFVNQLSKSKNLLKKIINILTIFMIMSSVNVAFAKGEDGKKSVVTEDEKSKKSVTEKPEVEEVVEYVAPKKANTDASFQSISKYNFLFYMVYKVKYMDAEGNNTTKATPTEE